MKHKQTCIVWCALLPWALSLPKTAGEKRAQKITRRKIKKPDDLKGEQPERNDHEGGGGGRGGIVKSSKREMHMQAPVPAASHERERRENKTTAKGNC